MADSFTKLFSSILASTVWQEPDTTRLTWIAMLAMADQNGHVIATVPGLAHFARVSLPDCETALATFLSPDKYSRTEDNEGRRIEAIKGGWALLNHAIYRAKRSDEARREYQRQWDRDNRKPKSDTSDKSDSQVSDSDRDPIPEQVNPTQAEAEADTEAEPVKQNQEHVQPAARDDAAAVKPKPKGAKGTSEHFNRVWAVFPVKKGKADAERHWKTHCLDPMADEIIAHIRKMESTDAQWLEGFIPHGSTYFCGKRWEDEPVPARSGVKAPAPAPPPESFGPAAALKPTEDPLTAALEHAKQRYNLGEFGTGTEAMAAYAAEQRSIRQRLTKKTE